MVARGDPVNEVVRVAKRHAADTIFASADVTRYAQRREA